MEIKEVKESLKVLRDKSAKRNFKQTIDIVLNLKDIDLKKTENQIDLFASLHFSKGKNPKICGLVAGELSEQSKKAFDNTVIVEDFPKYAKDKKAVKMLAREYDYFVAQANIMPKIASTFGRVFGPLGKMPNPKAGCVVPPNANLEVLNGRLQKIIRLTAKTQPIIQTVVGSEDMKDEEIADNIVTVYKALTHALPQGHNNVRTIFLKLTMSKPLMISDKGNVVVNESGDEDNEEENKEVAKEE
jgi:large subunit ribosomal protein L1